MKKLLPIIIALILFGGGAFYGGMRYGQNNPPAGEAAGKKGGQFSGADLQNLSPEERQARFGQMGMGGTGQRGGGGNRGGNFVSGEIIAKDDKSITVKLRDARQSDGQGGSKIVFFSDTTEISKFASGAPTDLEIGKTISVNGKANSDGSITAQTIQLRPNLPAPNNPAP